MVADVVRSKSIFGANLSGVVLILKNLEIIISLSAKLMADRKITGAGKLNETEAIHDRRDMFHFPFWN